VPNACTSFADALALGVDAVTIATPPDTHAAFAIPAASAGVAVLCEKPFALDATEAEVMLDAAEMGGVAHLVGHEFRLAEDRATITRAIAEGMIGEARLVVMAQAVAFVADPSTQITDWWFDPARGGGWLGASGSHVIDCVRAWTGSEFAEVSASLPRVSARDATSADDSFAIRATLTNGCEVMLTQTAASWGKSPSSGAIGTTFIAGTDGTLWLDGSAVVLADRAGTRVLPVPADIALPKPEASKDPRHGHRFTHLELGPYTRLCESLRARIEGTSLPEPVPIATFADGVAEMRVIDQVRQVV
jgi:predicted dehydrogenase